MEGAYHNTITPCFTFYVCRACSVISGRSVGICSNFRMIPEYRHLRSRKVIVSGEFTLGFQPE